MRCLGESEKEREREREELDLFTSREGIIISAVAAID